VNAQHLEPVTHLENLRRGRGYFREEADRWRAAAIYLAWTLAGLEP
jgi:hypothetical protein